MESFAASAGTPGRLGGWGRDHNEPDPTLLIDSDLLRKYRNPADSPRGGTKGRGSAHETDHVAGAPLCGRMENRRGYQRARRSERVGAPLCGVAFGLGREGGDSPGIVPVLSSVRDEVPGHD